MKEDLPELFKEYRLHFGLTQEIVGKLAKLKKNQYSRFESGRQMLKSNEARSISKVYGLEIYQITNPKHPKPSLKNLPIDTQEAIRKIIHAGSKPRVFHNKISLGKEIDKLISSDKMNQPITARELYLLLPDTVKERVNNGISKITDFLTRSPRNKIIKIVDRPEGKTGPGNWYQKINNSSN